MQRRTNIQTSSLIILLGILTIVLEFASYYYFNEFLLIWGISFVITMLCCHVLLEQTATYEACYQYSLLTIFVSVVIILITYFENAAIYLPYTVGMLGIAILNWLIPMLHSFLRHLLQYGINVEDYNKFYRNQSILFLILYLGAFLYGVFVNGSYPFAYPIIYDGPNFLPFGMISLLLENYLNGQLELNQLIIYLLSRILAYLPFGFYFTLLMRRQSRLFRILVSVALPFFIELIQLIVLPAYCDIDDFIYGFLGAFLGSLLFYLVNALVRSISGKEFLMMDTDYRYSNSNLHF